jgi:hypothetical protein
MGESEDVNFTVEGNKLTLNRDETSVEGTIDGNRVTLVTEDVTMVFEKQE